jgi:hypothetical protein
MDRRERVLQHPAIPLKPHLNLVMARMLRLLKSDKDILT